MKSKKNDYSEIFLYSFYFLSILGLLFGMYFKEIKSIEIGFSIFLLGTIFVNQGTIYYDDKILILGFLKINIENISDVEIENKKVLIKYENGMERKINFLSQLSSQNFFNFLKKLS